MMKPKLITKKTASKHCPSCKLQIPVACKTCTCGHKFTKSVSSVPDDPIIEPETPTSSTTRRRTERIKRERPNFYDSLEYITPTTRRRRTTSASLSSDGGAPESSGKKRPRGRPKQLKTKQPKDEDSNEGSSSTSSREKEEDMFASVSADKALQFAVILAEINRKYTTQNLKL